jgi:hypothetical protein
MSAKILLRHVLQVAAAFLLGTVAIISAAEEAGKQGDKDLQAARHPVVRPAIAYKPPLLDSSRDMEDAGARTAGGKPPVLEVFAPDHVGLTTSAQPTLYWHVKKPVTGDVEFTLVDTEGGAPLLKTLVGGRMAAAGIHQLDLSDHNISLQPVVSYQWTVAVVGEEGKPSESLVASGLIEYMEPGEGLSSRMEMSHGIRLVDVYANEGLWYDALESISSMIEQSPEDQSLVAVRTSLLNQVDLLGSADN